MSAHGYRGRVLFVDLSTQHIAEERMDDQVYRRFLGGYGLGVRILYERQRGGVDPLGPDALLGFCPGLLTGTGAPFSARYGVVAKSPLTGTWGDANAGGFIGAAIKRAGFDAVFCSGVAPRPMWLHLDDGRAALRDASALWGLDTREAEAALRREVADTRAGVAVIGPAGEARSLLACVINDGGRAAGRSGLGAVMGAKRLKAIVAEGGTDVPVADRAAFDRIWADLRPAFRPSPPRRALLGLLQPLMPFVYRALAARGISPMPDTRTVVQVFAAMGTAAMAAMASESGDAPVKNWSGVGARDFPILGRARRISDAAVVRYQTRSYRCDSCPLGCGGHVTVPDGPFAVRDAKRPEYETLAAFGTMALNDVVESIVKCGDLCDRYGMDTISTGTAVAFAIECFEAGIIGPDDTDGLALRWGDAETIVTLTGRIGRREGFGAVLADGVARAAARIGRGSERFAMHVGGQEPGMHDPKFGPSWATTYLTDPTPGRHTAGGAAMLETRGVPFPLSGVDPPRQPRYAYQGKGPLHAASSDWTQVVNASGLCMFAGMIQVLPYVELINAVTGWAVTPVELLETGARIQTVRQLFNVREGLRPADRVLPDRIVGRPPLDAGPTAGVTVDAEAMAAEYFAEMGWDRDTGAPAPERLAALDLEELVARAG